MSRSNYHLVKTDLGPNAYPRYQWLCGEDGRYGYRTDDPESPRLCSKCSAKYWGAKLKAEPNGFTIGGPASLGYDYKSAYTILNADGEVVGAVCFKHGWGGRWQINPVTTGASVASVEAGEEVKAKISPRALDWLEPKNQHGYRPERRATGFASKEQALAHVPEHVAAGRLKTEAAILTEHRTWAERLKRRQAERAAEEQAAADRRAQMLEGLRSIQENCGLTNLQAAALADAIAELEGRK